MKNEKKKKKRGNWGRLGEKLKRGRVGQGRASWQCKGADWMTADNSDGKSIIIQTEETRSLDP